MLNWIDIRIVLNLYFKVTGNILWVRLKLDYNTAILTSHHIWEKKNLDKKYLV